MIDADPRPLPEHWFTGPGCEARRAMLEEQLVPRGIHDRRVLKAMATVPRHCFVPESEQISAYSDRALPLDHGQTISQPYIVALTLQTAQLSPGQRVLEIGSGSGYQLALLAAMHVEAFGIEIIAALASSARLRLDRLDYGHARLFQGDGRLGLADHAPFDVILAAAVGSDVPAAWAEQLVEGGRLVAPIDTNEKQELCSFQKIDGTLRKQTLLEVRFVPLTRDGRLPHEL